MTGIISIIIKDGHRVDCAASTYIKAKTRQLREFGYPDLKEETVKKQLGLLLDGKKWSNVIGAFIKDDKPERLRWTKTKKP